MRLMAVLAAAACTPLQLEAGAAFSRARVQPHIEGSAGALPVALWVDRHEHAALWASGGIALAVTPDLQQVFVGPGLQLSRLRNFRSPDRTVDAISVRPEIGWSTSSGGTSRFLGASLGIVHEVSRKPLTLSIRAGSLAEGADHGFYATLGFGIAFGSSLWWMQ
jgi:hypothetical protein